MNFLRLFDFFDLQSPRSLPRLLSLALLLVLIAGSSGHIHKHRSRSRNRTPAHSAQPLVAEHPSESANVVSTANLVGPECDYVAFKQSGCEDEHGSHCNSSTGKCDCKPSHPVRLLDFCLPVSRLNGPCYTSGQCANVLNASCYIFGKEYDLETASGGHNLGRQVRNWPLGVCKCRLGHAFNESAGICEKRLVGSWCSNDKHCLLRSLNSICEKKRGECECSWGTAYEAHLDACVPSPIKAPNGKALPTGSAAPIKPGELGIAVASPSPSSNPYKPLYLSRCESDSECENSMATDRQPTTSRLYQKPTNASHSDKKGDTLTISASGKAHRTAKTVRSYRLQCIRGRCICGPTLVWEGGACREDWIAESDEIANNGTHHGRNRGDDLQEDEMDDDSSISWQTVTFMAILSLILAGITFRYVGFLCEI
jgi:hypothetical protein